MGGQLGAVFWAAALGFCALVCITSVCDRDRDRDCASPSPDNVVYTRHVFYAGGEYVNASATSTYRSGHVYAEHLAPVVAAPSPYPVIFIAGAGQTGTNFLHTPDGRPGWAHHFLAAGHHVYLTDQPMRGRSPWIPRRHGDPAAAAALSVRRLRNLQHMPTLVVTGEASFHAPYEGCTVEYLRQVGVRVDWWELAGWGSGGTGTCCLWSATRPRLLRWCWGDALSRIK